MAMANAVSGLDALNQAISSLHDTFDDLHDHFNGAHLSDLDPDLNILSNTSAKYYLEQEFSSLFARCSQFTLGFSLLNLNIRSMSKNFDFFLIITLTS